MSKFIVGLTGGIGSGKTTVSNIFKELGVTIVDADIIAKELVMPGSLILEELVLNFGSDILSSNNELNRKKLRQIVFSDKSKLDKLNSIMHPLISTRLKEQAIQAISPYVILVIPLLFENNLVHLVNEIIVVDIEPELQIERVMIRDNTTKEEVLNIINSQAPRELKLKKASHIITNNLDYEALKEHVKNLHSHYMRLINNSYDTFI